MYRRKPYKSDLRAQYRNQKHYANRRGIQFLFTFEEWFQWWNKSGHFHERGPHPNQYCMARGTPENPDFGCYEPGNVRAITNSQNRAEQDISYMKGNTHALGSKHSKEWKDQMSIRVKGTKNCNAKLNARVIRQIRSMRDKIPQATIARQFNVDPTTIRDILKGKSWSWVK